MKSVKVHPLSLLAGSALTAGILGLMSLQGTGGSFISGDVREFLSHVSMVDLPDGQGDLTRTVRISGINVQIVNGLGATNGYPIYPGSIDPALTQVNGVGNLIVGYNEGLDQVRTGSHNLVVGTGNRYSSFGGIVGTNNNKVARPYATVIGGKSNTASGLFSLVIGGQNNTASGDNSAVSGGLANTASGESSAVNGGKFNTASGYVSSIVGGEFNSATERSASVTGGHYNTASGHNSSVNGGRDNLASASSSTVSGGRENSANGTWSTVSGGLNRQVTGQDDWRAGSLFEDN